MATMSRDLAPAATQFFGGRICLDFANTLDWRTSDSPQELIPDYAALLAWSEARRTVAGPAIARLMAKASGHSSAAAAAMQAGYALRAEICRAAEALCRQRPVDPAPFNRRLAALPAQPRLVKHGSR